jgi:hypothetical protein
MCTGQGGGGKVGLTVGKSRSILWHSASDGASVLTGKARRESHQRTWSKKGKRVHRREVFLFEALEEELEFIKFLSLMMMMIAPSK